MGTSWEAMIILRPVDATKSMPMMPPEMRAAVLPPGAYTGPNELASAVEHP